MRASDLIISPCQELWQRIYSTYRKLWWSWCTKYHRCTKFHNESKYKSRDNLLYNSGNCHLVKKWISFSKIWISHNFGIFNILLVCIAWSATLYLFNKLCFQKYFMEHRQLRINRNTLRHVLKRLGYRWGRSPCWKNIKWAIDAKTKNPSTTFFFFFKKFLSASIGETRNPWTDL